MRKKEAQRLANDYTDDYILKGEFYMEKSDLKNGMIVQTRNGDKWLVNNGCLLSEEYGCIMIGVYSDELEHPASYCFDIVNVYISKAMSITDLFDEKYLNLIWERRGHFEWQLLLE